MPSSFSGNNRRDYADWRLMFAKCASRGPPCLRAGRTPLEPTQQGGVKQLGVVKPWSPNRSYGLVARLDPEYRPIASLHSRANGRRHGVTSCLTVGGRLYFCAKGDGIVAACATEGSKS